MTLSVQRLEQKQRDRAQLARVEVHLRKYCSKKLKY